MKLFKPVINIYIEGKKKMVLSICSITWKCFAYFRTLVHDNEGYDHIDVYFCNDFEDFCRFLKNDIPLNDFVDFSLNVKQSCLILGIEDKCFLNGRLNKILIDAAIKFYNSMEIQQFLSPLYEIQPYFPAFYDPQKNEDRRKFIKFFCDLTNQEDPRCTVMNFKNYS